MKKTLLIILMLIMVKWGLMEPVVAMGQKIAEDKVITETSIIEQHPKILKDKDNKKIKFFDKNGTVAKEISLTTVQTLEKKNGKEIKRVIRTLGKVAKNGKTVVITTTPLTFRDNESSKLSVINQDGRILWEKQLANGRFLEIEDYIIVSENGEKIVAHTYGNEESDPAITAYDKNGNEILSISRAGGLPLGGKIVMSPNGRYVGFGTFYENEGKGIMFWDLEKKVFKFIKGIDYLYNINNIGSAKIGYFNDDKGAKYIDLKKHMGK